MLTHFIRRETGEDRAGLALPRWAVKKGEQVGVERGL